MIIIDTYAWIEYFKGSEQGKIVEKYLNEEKTITPSVVLIELSCKSIKEGWDFEEYLKFIKSKSLIIGMDDESIIKCGQIYFNEKKKKSGFGLVDAIILTSAIRMNAKILTGDEHFRDVKEAVFIK